MFAKATRLKLRFPSTKGELTTEQLWDLPLITSREGGVDLNYVAKEVNRQLVLASETNFVGAMNSSQRTTLSLKLEVVLSVIHTMQAEKAKAAEAAKIRERRSKLLAALEGQETTELQSMTKEQILRELGQS
jgi:hypothetical protein